MKVLKAPAKVNITLEVLGKREDGYHEILSLLQTVDLQDTLRLEKAADLRFSCNKPRLKTFDNLAMKAALLLQKETGCSFGARIELIKVIPEAAGLGGGSTDAAATLRGLNRLWGLELSSRDLVTLAARLGSDVTFFLFHGTALAQGRGEKITSLPDVQTDWAVLLIPPFPPLQRKTERLYQSLELAHYSKGEFTRRAVEQIRSEGKVEPSLFRNVFEKVAFKLFPGLEVYWQRLIDCGAPWVHLAGSGPALFTFVEEKSVAEMICRRLNESGTEAYMAQTLGSLARNKGRKAGATPGYSNA